MRRVFAAISVVALAAIGLAGCGSSDAQKPESETSMSAPSEEDVLDDEFIKGDKDEADDSEQTLEEACTPLAGAMDKVTEALTAAKEQTATDPEAVVSAWSELADQASGYASSVTNSQVKPLIDQLATEASDLRDQIQKVFVDKDSSGMDQYTVNLASFSDTYDSLLNVCGGRYAE